MDWLIMLLLVFGSLLALYLFYYFVKKNKKHFIPSLFFLIFGLVLILMSQAVETGGGFLDVIYMLFGVLFVFISITIGLILIAFRTSRKNN